METGPLKEAFWAIVSDCLQRFHGFSPKEARLRVRAFRHRVEHGDSPVGGHYKDLFYHQEPFYVACDLAKRELSLSDYRDEYMRMTRLRYEPAERAAAAIQPPVLWAAK